MISPGDDLLSRWKHYHGPRMLNGRVRNGNGCGHLGMVTGKSHSAVRGWGLVNRGPNPVPVKIKKAAEQVELLYATPWFPRAYAGF